MLEAKVFKERAKILREWRKWSQRIAIAAREVLGEVEVYVIGSIAEGKAIAASDLDILVVSQKIPDNPREQSRLKTLIEEKAGLPFNHPVEIHLAKPSEKNSYLGRGKNIRLV